MRTLPLAVAPVYLGSAVAFTLDRFDPVLALLALVVSLFLQIGVNYANDYSDGIRGTDDDRVGPKRITAAGLARPDAVKRAAFITFGIAMAAGLVIVVVTSQWWLLGIGALAVLAAWFYTGGKSPYGYAGLGEVAVFVFLVWLQRWARTLSRHFSLTRLRCWWVSRSGSMRQRCCW